MNSNSIQNQLDSIDKAQIILTVISLLSSMSFVSGIAFILYTNFTSPEKISNNSFKYLVIISLISWTIPILLAIFSTDPYEIPVESKNSANNNDDVTKYSTFNFIQSLPVYITFYCLFFISYGITFMYITLLKIKVYQFIKEYGDDPKYTKYIRKLNYLVLIVGLSALIFIIDIVNEILRGPMDIPCDILEPMIIPFFFILFSMNHDQWIAFIDFYTCKKEIQRDNIKINDNENELL